jgi:hypothetical protein
MAHLIQVTSKTYNKVLFEKPEGSRLDLGITSDGYMTIYEGNKCKFKEDIVNIRCASISTPIGTIVVYRHGKHRKTKR